MASAMAVRGQCGAAEARSGAEPARPCATADLRIAGLARTAPWLCALELVCMLALVWSLRATAPPLAMGTWGTAVVVVGRIVVALRTRATRGDAGTWLRSRRFSIGLTCLHAMPWAVLALGLGDQPIDVEFLLVVALATMMTGAVLLAVVPPAALAWTICIAAAFGASLWINAASLPPGLLILFPVYLCAVLGGCRLVDRLLSEQLAVIVRERAANESIGLLLKEYEDQGAGWLWQIDAADRLTYVSPRICVLLGRSTSQLLGQSLRVVLGGDAGLDAAIVARRPFGDLDVEAPTPAGLRCVSLSGKPIVDRAGVHHGFRGVGADVTEARRSRDRLTQLASVDVLTGLPNRQRLREIFADAIAESVRTLRPCAILFLDLDGFKPVNDTFGHSIGDSVLRTVAQRLQAKVGTLGLIGRVGGDEFALLIHDARDVHAVEALACRLIAAIAEPFVFDKGEVRIGISVGCAFAPVDGVSIDDLLRKADLALYEAKSQGRGTFRLFVPRMQCDAEARLRLEQDLRVALQQGQFRIAYQPIVSAGAQTVLGFEALLRWQHPERGAIPPSVFIPLAEEAGLIGRIGAWVVEQACLDAARWPERMFVTVNVSPRQLLDHGLPQAIGAALARARLRPDRLELEVTENIIAGDAEGAFDVLRRLRALGIGIALDDFGTGHSSIGYLDKGIFHSLKIDGSFVRDAADKPETRAVIAAIVSLADTFGIQITAEGVETAADLERMRAFGCHRLQGYLFGRPAWHTETLALVAPPPHG